MYTMQTSYYIIETKKDIEIVRSLIEKSRMEVSELKRDLIREQAMHDLGPEESEQKNEKIRFPRR